MAKVDSIYSKWIRNNTAEIIMLEKECKKFANRTSNNDVIQYDISNSLFQSQQELSRKYSERYSLMLDGLRFIDKPTKGMKKLGIQSIDSYSQYISEEMREKGYEYIPEMISQLSNMHKTVDLVFDDSVIQSLEYRGQKLSTMLEDPAIIPESIEQSDRKLR